MNYSDVAIFVMEIIGTIALASSGAMLAIQKGMDLFGVCVLGVTTAVGGGLVRDIILGITPPNMFQKPIYTVVALAVSLILFFAIYFNPKVLDKKIVALYDHIMLIFDAIGLGIFTIVGINTALNAGYEQKFLLVFVGVVTGVGGGLMRDVMAQVKPYILTKHIYACASIAGAILCVFIISTFGRLAAMLISMAAVILIRCMASHYRWNLPKITDQDGK